MNLLFLSSDFTDEKFAIEYFYEIGFAITVLVYQAIGVL